MFDPVFGLLFLAAIIAPIAAIIYWMNPKRRSSGRRARLLAAAVAMAAVAAFLYYAGPELFVSNEGATQVYVIAPAQKADKFVEELAIVAGQYGVKSQVARMPDGEGSVLHSLGGNGKWLNLWSMNMPLDPDACGRHSEFRSDPGQYVLRVSRILPFGTKRSAREFATKIGAALTSMGYGIREKPLECSPLEKSQAPPSPSP